MACVCDASCVGSSNDSASYRTELISMRVCGDDVGADFPAKTFYASMIIKVRIFWVFCE